MTIRATYIEFETGREVEVEIIHASKVNQTAVVQQVNWNPRTNFWWEKRPEMFVDRDDLINVRVLCERCGEEFDPSGKCECGWDWREAPTDEDERWLAGQEIRQ